MLMEFYDSPRFSHTDLKRKNIGRMNHEFVFKWLLKIQSSAVAAAGTFCDVLKIESIFGLFIQISWNNSTLPANAVGSFELFEYKKL